jgi:hypothetical protein
MASIHSLSEYCCCCHYYIPFWNDHSPSIQHACGMKSIYYCSTGVFTRGFLFWKLWQLTQCSDYTIKCTTTEQGCDSWKEQEICLYFTLSRLALGSSQSNIQWILGGSFLKAKQPGHEADHSLARIARITNCTVCISIIDMVLNKVQGQVSLCPLFFFLNLKDSSVMQSRPYIQHTFQQS